MTTPNTALQGARSAPLRSPPSRKPFGSLVLTLILTAMTLACQTASPANSAASRKQPKDGVAVTLSPSGIGLQAERDAVLRAFGEPGSEKPQVYDTWRYDYGDMVVLDYPGMRLRLVGGIHRSSPFRVLDIEVAVPAWTVHPGLFVGMKADEAKRRLPGLRAGTDIRSVGRKALIYTFEVPNTPAGGKLLLVLNRDLVTQIILTSDLD
jgi:hypothetical protein